MPSPVSGALVRTSLEMRSNLPHGSHGLVVHRADLLHGDEIAVGPPARFQRLAVDPSGLFTVVVLFALQGNTITSEPLTVARIALPLLGYFFIMWFLGFATGRALSLSYPRTTTLAFTAASNDFELAIAVAIGVFGVTSGQALAGVVGPLIEVPVLLALVYVALWLRRRLSWPHRTGPTPAGRP